MVASRKRATDTSRETPSRQRVPRAAKPELESVQFLTAAEWYALFDAQARERLGISGAEFIRKWKSGEFADPDQSDVIETYMLMPAIER